MKKKPVLCAYVPTAVADRVRTRAALEGKTVAQVLRDALHRGWFLFSDADLIGLRIKPYRLPARGTRDVQIGATVDPLEHHTWTQFSLLAGLSVAQLVTIALLEHLDGPPLSDEVRELTDAQVALRDELLREAGIEVSP